MIKSKETQSDQVQGWLLAGLAVRYVIQAYRQCRTDISRLVLSTGLHQIRSLVFAPEPTRDPFLRNRTYLLPPVEDATDLAERIATL